MLLKLYLCAFVICLVSADPSDSVKSSDNSMTDTQVDTVWDNLKLSSDECLSAVKSRFSKSEFPELNCGALRLFMLVFGVTYQCSKTDYDKLDDLLCKRNKLAPSDNKIQTSRQFQCVLHQLSKDCRQALYKDYTKDLDTLCDAITQPQKYLTKDCTKYDISLLPASDCQQMISTCEDIKTPKSSKKERKTHKKSAFLEFISQFSPKCQKVLIKIRSSIKYQEEFCKVIQDSLNDKSTDKECPESDLKLVAQKITCNLSGKP